MISDPPLCCRNKEKLFLYFPLLLHLNNAFNFELYIPHIPSHVIPAAIPHWNVYIAKLRNEWWLHCCCTIKISLNIFMFPQKEMKSNQLNWFLTLFSMHSVQIHALMYALHQTVCSPFSKAQFIDPSDNSVATGVFESLFRQRHFNKNICPLNLYFCAIRSSWKVLTVLADLKRIKSVTSTVQPWHVYLGCRFRGHFIFTSIHCNILCTSVLCTWCNASRSWFDLWNLI